MTILDSNTGCLAESCHENAQVPDRDDAQSIVGDVNPSILNYYLV